MELVRTYTCPCSPGKIFASSSSLYAHKKTKKHFAYEEKNKEQKIQDTKKENEILTINLKLKDRDEQIEKLIMEKHELIKQLEKHSENKKHIDELCNKILNLQTANKRLKSENTSLRTMLSNIKKDI